MASLESVANPPEVSTVRKAIRVTEMTRKQRANAAYRSLLNCSLVTAKYCNAFGDQDLVALEDELDARTKKLINGDMKFVEAMLFAQAQALQSIFVNLALRASDDDFSAKQQNEYMNLALRAESGSRAALQTLIEMKKPRAATFVGQQNVAYQQQVNNGEVLDGPNVDPRRGFIF